MKPAETPTKKPRGGIPVVESIYLRAQRGIRAVGPAVVPFVRRFLRFCALPYCFFGQIDWDQCAAPKLRVAYDLLYIFFRLKYYPDNYSLCRLWEVPRSQWHLYYGSMYEPYQRRQLQKEVQLPEYQVLFADKEVCQRLCVSLDLPVPRLLGVLGAQEDPSARIREAVQKTVDGRLVIKPVRGAGGRSVIVVEADGDELVAISRAHRGPVPTVPIGERCVLQEAVTQHADLAAMYPLSLNTIRVQTLLKRNQEVIILGSAIRFGRNGSRVDNMSAGGIGVGVDVDTGQLKQTGRDFDSREYDRHPETGLTFKGYQVPYWPETLAVVERAQKSFTYFRLVGFDIAVTPTGPLIIEINPWSDNVFVEECYGPILARAQTVLAFDEYDLLINAPTRHLARSIRGERLA
jgi:hypothetical protein